MGQLSLIQQGSFTSTGAAKQIDLPGGADYFKVYNFTEANKTAGVAFQFEWYYGFADGYAQQWLVGGSNAVSSKHLTSGGFTYYSAPPAPGAAVSGTVITAANPAVCTATAHGYSVGDHVRIYNNAAMKQIGGMIFEITAVGDADHFTLGYLDASGFAAAETSFSARKVPPKPEVMPGARFITAVSKAAQGVVTFSEAHPFKIGDELYFRVPSDFGMVELDQQFARVEAVGTATVTLDLNTAAFSTFAFPASSTSVKFPFGGLYGKKGLYDDWFSSSRSLLDLDPFRSGQFVPYMQLPGGAGFPAGAANDVIYWQAFRSE